MRASLSAVIRGLGSTYVDGTERMEIHISLEHAMSFPHAMNIRIPVQLEIGGMLYHAGVRATPKNRYVWICPDIRKMSHESITLSRALTDAGFQKNDRVYLDVDGSWITVRAAYTSKRGGRFSSRLDVVKSLNSEIQGRNYSRPNLDQPMPAGFEFAAGEVVQMWCARRLPYIDRQTVEERAACDRLRYALRQMPDDKSMILSARYTSPHDAIFDIENVLAYNVGMTAFSGAARRGMLFERVRATPPAAPSGTLFDHHHAYMLAPVPPRPIHGTTIMFDLPSVCEVDSVWWAIAGAVFHACAPITGRFALHVEVGLNGRASLPGVVKKLLDGIVAGLQADPNPDAEAVRRLAIRMSRPADAVATRLSAPSNAVLGSRQRLLRARGDSVQWNPGDDMCDSVAIIATETFGVCAVTVIALQSASV